MQMWFQWSQFSSGLVDRTSIWIDQRICIINKHSNINFLPEQSHMGTFQMREVQFQVRIRNPWGSMCSSWVVFVFLQQVLAWNNTILRETSGFWGGDHLHLGIIVTGKSWELASISSDRCHTFLLQTHKRQYLISYIFQGLSSGKT